VARTVGAVLKGVSPRMADGSDHGRLLKRDR